MDPRFARDFAETTGYIPRGLMAAPLLHKERSIGVLEVLDRPQRSRFSLQEMDLLALFANQAAIALDLLQSARRAKDVLEGGENELALVARVASALDTLDPEVHESGTALLRALADVLGRR